MNEIASDGGLQYTVQLSQEDIEILLAIANDVDDLYDDELFVIESLARALPPDSAYDRRWFENKLATQQSSGQ